MITHLNSWLALSLCFVLACDEGDDETESESGTTSSSTDTDTGGESIACGELECAVGQVCLTFPQDPSCTNLLEGEACPPNTTQTQCGGAGLPCCCEPPPPTLYECVDPACEGPVDCTCLVDVCIPSCTATAAPDVFFCETPPAP